MRSKNGPWPIGWHQRSLYRKYNFVIWIYYKLQFVLLKIESLITWPQDRHFERPDEAMKTVSWGLSKKLSTMFNRRTFCPIGCSSVSDLSEFSSFFESPSIGFFKKSVPLSILDINLIWTKKLFNILINKTFLL